MDHILLFLTQYGVIIGMPLLFMAIVAWIYRPDAKKRFQADGNIPFYGDKKAAKARPGHS